MGRIIGGVIVGYVVMLCSMFVLFTIAWMALGANGAFQPHSWHTSGLWVAISAVAALVAAVPASRVCSLIARGDRRALQGLVLLIVVLGLVFAFPVILRTDSSIAGRGDMVSMQDAMSHAAQPAWLALLMPLVGAIGAVFGWKHRAVEI